SSSASTSIRLGRTADALPAVCRCRLGLPDRALRRRDEPQPHPPCALSDSDAVVDLRLAALGGLRARRHGPDLQGRQARNSRGRSRGAVAVADRHRRQRHRSRPHPRTGTRRIRRREDGGSRRDRGAAGMTWLAPLVVAVPLLSGALVAGGDHVAPRALQNAIGVCGSAATFVLAVLLFRAAERHEVLTWFGGWRPRSGIAVGIDFAVDPLAAGMCALIAGLICAALVYSITYMPEAAKLYDTLLLVAAGSMCGFVLSGDLFNLFVWLEL